MATELVFQSASELGKLVKAKKLSPVEITRAFLDRAEALNPQVKAFITVSREEALRDAAVAEKEIRAGRYRGPLHGIPFAPKDNIATAGIRTTNGSKVTADWVPDFDATIAAKLKQAGAILMGKLNLLEFAMGSGRRGAIVGPARNPWNLAHTPSGSSSGSGASLAARMTPLAVGSDTGGPIRSPAKSCGVVGLKPTYGRVSRHGVTTLSWTCDHAGPMARTVADVALMLQAMAGPDPRDPSSASEAVPDYSRALAGGVKGLRIGVPTEFFFDGINPEPLAAIKRAIELLRSQGAELVDVKVPHADLAGAALSVLQGAEGAVFHEKNLKEKAHLFEPLVRERLESGLFYSAVDYIKAQQVRTVLQEETRRVFEACDVMVAAAGNAARLLDAEIGDTDAAPGPSVGKQPDPWSLGNATGIPAIVLPCGFTAGPPVLPMGIQFYAKPLAEATLFRVAHAYQAATDWHTRRPPIG